MVGIYVTVIICIVVGFYLGVNDLFGDFWWGALCGVLGLIIGVIISLFAGVVVDIKADKETYKKSEEKILALNDNMGTKGRFFLGSGNINDSMKYVYLVENKNGKKMKDAESYNTYINEDNNEEPRIEYHYERYKNKKLEKYFFGIFNDTHKHNAIYIPEDSINYQYNIDLE